MKMALVLHWRDDADKETVTLKMLQWAQMLADAGVPYGMSIVTPVFDLTDPTILRYVKDAPYLNDDAPRT